MKKIRESGWLLVPGVLLILAGICAWVAPGFLSIGGRAHGEIGLTLLTGFVFLAAAMFKMMND